MERREERFERIYRSHREAVSAYARRRAPASLADDAVAETFLVCWRKLDRVPDDALPWLYAVARKTLANERRRLARPVPTAAAEATAEPAPVDDPRLAAAFARLGERDREVLRLVAWEGLAAAEAATVLGCSVVAGRVRFHRAKRRLAALLAETEDEPAAARPRLRTGGATR